MLIPQMSLTQASAQETTAGHPKPNAWIAFLFPLLLSVFILQYSTYLIHWTVADRLIKLVSLGLILLLFRAKPFVSRYRVVFGLYAGLFSAVILGAAIQSSPAGLIQFTKYIIAFATLPVILRVAIEPDEMPALLLTPVPWAVFFSAQCLALFLVIYFKVPLTHPLDMSVPYRFQTDVIHLQRYNNMEELTFGILGFANGIWSISTGQEILRAQSWFIEPAKLAAYLIYPFFLSLGLFLSKRSRKFLLVCGSIVVGLLTTFSLSAFLSIVDAVTMLAVLRSAGPEGRRFGRRLLLRGVLAILASLALNLSILRFLQGLYPYHDSNVFLKAIARAPSTQTLIRGASVPPTL